MHDPWDVAATRRSDQYVSCMKINGVPLLPPVLSKQCRKEMQYYKVLALEVEKRISLLSTYVESSDSKETIDEEENCIIDTDAAECDSVASDKEKSSPKNDPKEKDLINADVSIPIGYDSIRSDITVIDNSDLSPVLNSPKLVIGVNMVISDIFNEESKYISKTNSDETPERDYNCVLNKQIISVNETEKSLEFEVKKVECPAEAIANLIDKASSTTLSSIKESKQKTGPPSLSSSKSVDDIHSELSREGIPGLVRQSSYTILKPGPALLAHLEVQSLTSGVEMSSISMSESCSNLSWSKKRRSWDLESAKVKWSSMASELNTGVKKDIPQKLIHIGRSSVRPGDQQSPSRARSTMSDRTRRSVSNVRNGSGNNRTLSKTATSLKGLSPTKKQTNGIKSDHANNIHDTPQSMCAMINQEINGAQDHEFTARLSMITSENAPSQPQTPPKSAENASPVKQDPSSCIRELYDKIQNQQLLRMANLIEKQKKEQLLLQQSFEEQNSLFYKQLKTICPKSPTEIKEAWSEKPTSIDGTPVSLSQLIHTPSKPSNGTNNTKDLSSTLNDTNNYIHKTEEALKKSRTILKSNSATKYRRRSIQDDASMNSNTPGVRPKSVPSSIPRRDDRTLNSSTKTLLQSPRNRRNSNSSDTSREGEPILTDRTNDTMADLNFTLTSDENADFALEPLKSDSNTTFVKDDNKMGVSHSHSPTPYSSIVAPSKGTFCASESIGSNIDIGQKCTEYSLQRSRNPINSEGRVVKRLFKDRPHTVQENLAAARIVAGARGYLVRRLLRTERVQATVQTIRDALVCALQLHQDRGGIRGADVDLHRRLIQQITAACYSLNDTFITSSARERCSLIAQDRERQRVLTAKQMSSSSVYVSPRSHASAAPAPHRRLSKRKSDVMSHSECGAYSSRAPRPGERALSAAMTHSSHEMYSGEKWLRQTKSYVTAAKELHARRPWR